MAYNPNNPNGQATAANSAPVVLASNVTSSISIAEAATGGATVKRIISAATNNPTTIKDGPGKVTGWYIYNASGTVRVVRFFNATSPPGVYTSPYLTIAIPALSAANCPFPAGINFDTGICIATTTTVDDATTTAVGANELIINIFYK